MLKLLNWENQCRFLSFSVTNGRVKLPPTSPFSPFPLNMTTLEAVRDSYLQTWQQNLVYWSQRCRLEPGPGSESDWIPLTPWGPWACWVSSGLAHLLSCTSYASLPSFFWLCCSAGGVLVPQPGIEPRPLQEKCSPSLCVRRDSSPSSCLAFVCAIPTPTESHRCPLELQCLHFIVKVTEGHLVTIWFRENKEATDCYSPTVVISFLCF